MARIALSKKWKGKLPVSLLLLLELGGITASLALFGIASPDTFRDKLWQAGGVYGYNSNPDNLIYYYANYQTPPATPLIWSPFLTSFNVAIAIVFMFALLVKTVLFVCSIFYPIMSLVFHLLAVGLWTFSLYGQLSPDYSDPAHPAKFPWYITKSCYAPANLPPLPGGLPPLTDIPHYCMMARATLAVTVIMVAIYATYIALALHSLFILKKHHAGKDFDNDSNASDEIEEVPATMATKAVPQGNMIPMTPRTQAYHSLDAVGAAASLPLRNYQSSQ